MPKVDTPAETGLQRADLSDDEASMLMTAYERSLEDVRGLNTESLLSKIREYQGEIELAAQVAKATFNKDFDGSNPQSGAFGIDRIHSGYFGWDSWYNCPDATAGSVTTWLDNSVPDNLSGSGGVNNPLTVGEPVVHVILGVGSYVENPKATRLKFRLNDQPRTAISTETEFFNTDLRAKFFDTPILLKDDDDVFAEFYGAESGAEALYPIGLTFIEAKDYRELDPADMAGTDDDNIVVQ